ncbi:MAG: hypothetical protein ACD_75C02316G0001 [uncultured bacterium]|nr:MAG: hypothetical protein ACD_75C02316G0001 [uncultured bacterium]
MSFSVETQTVSGILTAACKLSTAPVSVGSAMATWRDLPICRRGKARYFLAIS